jgi:hypothetical protein
VDEKSVSECARMGKHVGLYKGLRIKGQGRNPMICSPQDYQILIDSMESENGLMTAMKKRNSTAWHWIWKMLDKRPLTAL